MLLPVVAFFALAARLLITDGISEKADDTIDVPGERESRAIDVPGERDLRSGGGLLTDAWTARK